MQIDLMKNQDNGWRARVYAAEHRPNNNCAIQRPETLLRAEGDFRIPLADIGQNVEFDSIEIHLRGYGCGSASNSVGISGLKSMY